MRSVICVTYVLECYSLSPAIFLSIIPLIYLFLLEGGVIIVYIV